MEEMQERQQRVCTDKEHAPRHRINAVHSADKRDRPKPECCLGAAICKESPFPGKSKAWVCGDLEMRNRLRFTFNL